MNQIITYITDNWISWLFMCITFFSGVGYRNMQKKMVCEAKKSKAISDGMQAILRDRIISTYNHYSGKGHCPIYAKENLRRMYDAYHALGGNDVATQLRDELMEMPTDDNKEDKKDE